MLDVLNYFHLSNLELKATAYQFYHLLQRITNPLEPASVINVYREFWRMTQIWQWMKHLKWAGYGMKKALGSEVTQANSLFSAQHVHSLVSISWIIGKMIKLGIHCTIHLKIVIYFFFLDGFTNEFLWLKGTLKLIMSDKRVLLKTSGCQRVVEWFQSERNIKLF